MGLKIEINPNDEVRGMTISELDNVLFLLTRETEFTSYFIYSCTDKRKDEKAKMKYAGACKNTDFDEGLADDLPENVDIYICPNGMVLPSRRRRRDLISIQNLVIDIDAHNADMTIEELNNHINNFKKQLMEKLNIKPNFIHHTGRGLHLWYCIEPLHESLDYAALAVIDMLCKHITEIMEELEENILEIDKKATMNLNGIFRLPYTYNTKAKKWSTGELIHETIPHVNQLKDKLIGLGFNSEHWKTKKQKDYEKSKSIYQTYKAAEEKKKKEEQNEKLKTIWAQKRIDDMQKDYLPCINHRLNFLDYLLRNEHIKDGRRHNTMLVLGATLIRKYDSATTWQMLYNYNKMIDPPLTIRELNDICKEVEKKTHKFKTETFLCYIKPTSEELKEFYKNTKTKKQRKREAKKEKYKKVVELFLDGESKSAIARKLNLSRPTVIKIIRESL